ncbi:hypothetical protein AJ80_01621 [Polytolypa hystricis UAMH7299]|uniref:S-adenosyl-L-methionine-dependent methyltransferase n=1 Tax=Polytolypa hystricis (strain UAMH7299) TaxID=1447883 RepID=A0A2B7YZB6_POLH7|nr:hypothetical protein AJ80_01621 [Polytolypa hystricis UAMH7299]
MSEPATTRSESIPVDSELLMASPFEGTRFRTQDTMRNPMKMIYASSAELNLVKFKHSNHWSLYDRHSWSSNTSLSSAITNYRVENGRRYHAYKDGEYWGPNDDEQNLQLSIGHHLFYLLHGGKLLLAPIAKDIERAIDIGTGTGQWAIDFADEYPHTSILGTDLSPIQPAFVPPNCRFEVDDACDAWVHPPNYFDLVHVRSLYGSVADWPAFYQQAYKHTKPGGYFEHCELTIHIKSDDGTLPDDHIFCQWSRIFLEAGEKINKTFRIAEHISGHAKDAGFEDVTEKWYKIPIGGWSSDPKMKTIGKWNYLQCDHGIEGWAMALLTRVMKWSYEDVQVFLDKMRAGLRDKSVHSYFEAATVYGRKPLEA